MFSTKLPTADFYLQIYIHSSLIFLQVFSELFDKVIDERHNGYKPGQKHPTDLDWTKVRIQNVNYLDR